MIEIKRNGNGDSRTGNLSVTKNEFHEANLMHINDVKNILNDLSVKLINNGNNHDLTKLIYEDLFYNDYKSSLRGELDFKDGPFYQLHVKSERHHPNEDLKDDINLLDILEMISDVLAASLARTGKPATTIKLKDGILEKAFNNTIKLINSNLELKE